jgi:hypothetical protein
VGVLIVALPCYLIWTWAAREEPDKPPLPPPALGADEDDIWGDRRPPEPKGKEKAVASEAVTGSNPKIPRVDKESHLRDIWKGGLRERIRLGRWKRRQSPESV